ncbi:MAG: response regulator [Gammaproteobacteria bacterium]
MQILLADDHCMVREAMVQVLESALDKPIVFEAGDCDETLALAEKHPAVDLVLLDLNMPGPGGLVMIGKLKRLLGESPIVILSGSFERGDVRSAMALGAAGFIPKTLSQREISGAIRLVLAGERYVPSDLSGAGDPDATSGAGHSGALASAIGVTPRQMEVLRMLVAGAPNKVIAYRLGLSESTVKLHVNSILRALGVRNRTEAAMKAREMGVRADPGED